MKHLILITILFSNLANAENWLNHSKILNNSKEAFSLQSDCEKISGEKCYDLGDYPSSVYEEVDSSVSDYSKPIYSKLDTQSCLNESDCSSKFIALTCSQIDYEKIKNLDLLQIYCVKLTGYESKTIKIIQLSNSKLTAYLSLQIQKENEAAKEAEVQEALKRMEHGRRVIAVLLTRNNSKSLTTYQIAQMNTVYSTIKSLLETGSLKTAKDAINAISPDGILITAEDKNALITELEKYPGV
jgi:hypothetical protein